LAIPTAVQFVFAGALFPNPFARATPDEISGEVCGGFLLTGKAPRIFQKID